MCFTCSYFVCLLIFYPTPSFSGLKFLVRLCTDLGLKDAQEYANKLKKAEKAKELRDQVSLCCLSHSGEKVGFCDVRRDLVRNGVMY